MNVEWKNAIEFCRKLTDRERAAGRLPSDWEYTLPTEAQWERACRARTDTLYSFGNDRSNLGEYAWYDVNADDSHDRSGGRGRMRGAFTTCTEISSNGAGTTTPRSFREV